jgi:hypothetical protein
MNTQLSEKPFDRWLTDYKVAYHDLLVNEPEFARWLEEDYVPIAGGWQY